MKDGEIGVVRATDTTLDISNVQTAPENDVLLTPDPHPHFTIKVRSLSKPLLRRTHLGPVTWPLSRPYVRPV
jgi:hypothetical protein